MSFSFFNLSISEGFTEFHECFFLIVRRELEDLLLVSIARPVEVEPGARIAGLRAVLPPSYAAAFDQIVKGIPLLPGQLDRSDRCPSA